MWFNGKKGTHRQGSDIGVMLFGENLTYTQLGWIEAETDDLLLPYPVDLSLYTHIDNTDLLDTIQRIGQLFYQRDENTNN